MTVAGDPGPGDGSRAVAIGGGHGLARTLQALTGAVDHVTAVVTVADDGGSSGRLRRDLDVLPPGDLRMALTSLTRRRELAEVLQYRFPRGELEGHSLGNLVLVALSDLADGDVVAGLDRLARLLELRGRVLPCTTESVTLFARAGGTEVAGQAAVAATSGIEQVWLQPQAPVATPAAVAAIERADLVVLGPGSLFTSLLPNLLVPGIADAVVRSTAPVVLVGNLREQPGETQDMTLEDHLAFLAAHVPTLRPDALLAHEGRTPVGPGAALHVDRDRLADHVPRVVTTDLLDGGGGHDPAALRAALATLLGGPRERSRVGT